VDVRTGDMHALDLRDRQFDLVLLLHALTYSSEPQKVFDEVARVLKPGGRVLASTLGEHDHRAVVEPFDHRNLGFTCDGLTAMAAKAGLAVVSCERLSRERRAPHFEVISLLARKPAAKDAP
jgi:ArsR family transcriptional regulator